MMLCTTLSKLDLDPSLSVFNMSACRKDFRRLGPQDTVNTFCVTLEPWRDSCRHGNP